MAKLLFIILASLSVWKNVVQGKGVCSHYDEKGCVHPDITKHGHYINQWAVNLPKLTVDKVKPLMENNGFIYLGPVMGTDSLHMVSKKGTPEKHVMPNKWIIEQLKNIENVESVEQMHMFDDLLVYSVKDANKIELQHLNPNKIVLNDGSNNWERIAMAMKNKDNNPAMTRVKQAAAQDG